MQNVSEVSGAIVMDSNLRELVHRVLQQGSCILSLVPLAVKQLQFLLHLQQPKLSLIQRQLQLQRTEMTVTNANQQPVIMWSGSKDESNM